MREVAAELVIPSQRLGHPPVFAMALWDRQAVRLPTTASTTDICFAT